MINISHSEDKKTSIPEEDNHNPQKSFFTSLFVRYALRREIPIILSSYSNIGEDKGTVFDNRHRTVRKRTNLAEVKEASAQRYGSHSGRHPIYQDVYISFLLSAN